jgi:heme exporter protein C
MGTRSTLLAGYWAVTAALTVAAGVATYLAPVEATMGVIQKVFYLHLPAAVCTALACLATFVASIGFLARRRMWWDDLAAAAARVAVQLCTVVLLTGMIWGKVAWGQWWTWSPRLVFVLVLWLLYVVYLLVRASVESAERRAAIAAAYGLLAFLDVPLVWFSVKLLPDIHPIHVTLAGPMRVALGVWFAAVGMLSVGLVVAQYQVYRAARNRRTAEDDVGGPAPVSSLTLSAGGLL